MRIPGRSLLPVLLALCLVVSPILIVPPTTLAQSQRIEPQAVALKPTDLPVGFTVVKEDSKPMDPGPGVLYSVVLDRPINAVTAESGPVGVTQVIGRFDQTLSYEGFLDVLRQDAIENGFELVP